MDPATQVFHTVGRIFTGPGRLSSLAEAKEFGSSCLVVTGMSSARETGTLDKTLSILASAGVRAEVFEGVEEDPTVSTVDTIRSMMASCRAVFLVGLGGGSAIDAAKAAAGLAHESAATSVFLVKQQRASGGIPVVAIPTTSGTGAEATPNAVIRDPAAPVKASIRNGNFLPAIAIVDPELTLSCPPRVTAYSGLDAIVQAVESFVSIHAGPLSDAFAFEAFRLLWMNLPVAWKDGSNLSARAACAYGSLMAGIALANARLGAVHGVAHPVGVRWHVPHGLACAILAPEVFRMNAPCSAAKFARLRGVAGCDIAQAMELLNAAFDVYADARRCAMSRDDMPVIAEESMPSGSLKANPLKFTKEDVLRVLDVTLDRIGMAK